MAARSAGGFELRSTVTWICLVWSTWLVSCTTVGWVTPADSAAAVAWATVRVGDVTNQDWPPLKSMPRLRPRVPSEMIPSRMTKAEAANHTLRRPMKSNAVSPRYRRTSTFGRFSPAASCSYSSSASSSSSSKSSSRMAAASSSVAAGSDPSSAVA